MHNMKLTDPFRVKNMDLARKCLTLISCIAARGARSQDPDTVGYALEELSQVLFERTRSEERALEPVSPAAISTSNLQSLLEELDFVGSFLAEPTVAESLKTAPRGAWN